MICGTYILQQLYSAMIGAGIYYMTWVLKNKNLFGQFAWAVNIPLIIALIFTPTLVGKWNGMYKLNLRGYILAVIGRALVVVAGYMGSIPLMMAFTALAALGQGPWQGDMNAVIASCSEYTLSLIHIQMCIRDRYQIANAQQKLQDLSSNEELSLEDKMKKRQEIQQEITNLNQQLRQHQIEQRKEQQSKKSSMDDMVAGTKNTSAKKGTGLSQAGMRAMISAESSMRQAKVQGSMATQMEGRAGVLESEIKQDAGKGNTEKKEEELADLQAKAQSATASQMSSLSDANKSMEEAAKADNRTDAAETKKDQTQKAENTQENADTATDASENADVKTETAETIKNPASESGQSVVYTPIDIRLQFGKEAGVMSEIKSFSDYTSKYNSNVDFSALFSGTSDSSSVGNTNMLSDYAAIKNGSYRKLMKAYYAKQDAEKLSGKGDTSQKLTLMKTSADSLKKSADALNDSSLWGKKKIKKKDEKTGKEIEVEDYDWDKITKAVKSFVEDYNDVVKEAGESNTKDVLRNASWMTGMTDKNSNMLAKIGITIGKGNKLELDEDALKQADISSLKTVFTGYNSFVSKISQKATGISNAANRASATYTNNGTYSKTDSLLTFSKIDEEVQELF